MASSLYVDVAALIRRRRSMGRRRLSPVHTSNNVEATTGNIVEATFDFVEATFDFVATNGKCRTSILKFGPFDNVEYCFDIVAESCRTKFRLSTKSKQIEHFQFVQTN